MGESVRGLRVVEEKEEIYARYRVSGGNAVMGTTSGSPDRREKSAAGRKHAGDPLPHQRPAPP